jgi:hypothetical protein
MAENDHIKTIYKSRNILLDILKQRGYDTGDYDGFGINEIHAMYQSKQLDLLLSNKSDDIEKKTYIKYNLAKTLRPNNIYELIEDLYNIEEI